MPTTNAKLTAEDLKDVVNPTDSPELFQFGTDPKLMSEAKVDKLLQRKENAGLSALHEHYRDIASGRSSGEILVNKDLGARGGETTLQLAWAPVVEGSLVLYKNFKDNNIPWISRSYDHAMDEADYALDTATGEIVLSTALVEGDYVYADYQHDAGASMESIRELILDMARVELYQMFPNWNGASDSITEMQELIDTKIMMYSTGDRPKGIHEIDNVDYLVETRKNARDTMKLPYMRGAI